MAEQKRIIDAYDAVAAAKKQDADKRARDQRKADKAFKDRLRKERAEKPLMQRPFKGLADLLDGQADAAD